MSEAFIGQINMYAFSFPPRSWSLCNGQTLSISEFTSLFALISTTYGGDGRVTFNLPNLQCRAPIHWGSGPGLTPRPIGAFGGFQYTQLSTAHMPAHNHEAQFTGSGTASLQASKTNGTNATPAEGDFLAVTTSNGRPLDAYIPAGDVGETVNLGGIHGLSGGTVAVGQTGDGQAFSNESPYQAVSFCIALQGLFPPRN